MRQCTSVLTGAVGVGLLLCLGIGQAAAQAPAAVATVNGEAITNDEFVTTLKARYGDRCLNALLMNLAVRQAAKAAQVEVTGEELERRFLSTERLVEMRAPITGENFAMWLAKRNLTAEYFRAELHQQILLEKMVEKEAPIQITDQDVANFYQRNRDALKEPAMVQVAHVCVASEKEARQIRADVTQGKIKWDDAVAKYTLDPWTKTNGGDLGFLQASDNPIAAAALALKTNGELSEAIQSPMGWHILKRLAYREARTPPFEEVQESIRQQMERTQLTQRAIEKRDAIRRTAKVQQIEAMPPEPALPVVEPLAPAAPAAAAAPATP